MDSPDTQWEECSESKIISINEDKGMCEEKDKDLNNSKSFTLKELRSVSWKRSGNGRWSKF